MEWDLEITPPTGKEKKSTVVVRRGEDILTTDTVNMLSLRCRKQFSQALSEIVGEESEAILDKIGRRWNEVYQQHQHQQTTASTEPHPEDVDERAERLLSEMPSEVRQDALDYLRDTKLVTRILDDIGTLGVAGETKLSFALYLTGVSRLLDRPLAVRVKGVTSSGKSFVIERVAGLFPDEAVLLATQITPQALYYMRPGSLRHRWVVAGERSRKEDDETAEATRALREMISSGRISKQVPAKTGNGTSTIPIHQEGPIAFTESTTLTRVFDEDENRCLSLFTDESEDQTRRILQCLGKEHGEGSSPSAAMDQLILLHHAIQRTLRRREVVVPFAARLAELFPAGRVEARRAFPHLLGVIRAIALLHQFQRDEDEQGRRIATRQDYHLTTLLLAAPMRRLLGGGTSEGALKFHKRLKEWSRGKSFTSTEAQERETTGRSSIHGWLTELHGTGALEQVEEGRGRKAAVWKLTDVEPDQGGTILPKEVDVFEER